MNFEEGATAKERNETIGTVATLQGKATSLFRFRPRNLPKRIE